MAPTFLTARKRANGLGAAREGTRQHWNTIVTSAALLIITPFFVFTFGRVLGRPYEEVVAFLGRPFPAVVIALMLLVGLIHFRRGGQVVLEDYAEGMTRKLLVVALVCVTYGLLAVGLYATARLAL